MNFFRTQFLLSRVLEVMLLSTIILGTGCVTTDTRPKKEEGPQPKTIQMRKDASINAAKGNTDPVFKDLFEIVMDNDHLWVNQTPVNDLKTLTKLLKKYQAPMITLATHKCLTREKSLAVMALIQQNTDTPIAYKAYGDYDDAHCHTNP